MPYKDIETRKQYIKEYNPKNKDKIKLRKAEYSKTYYQDNKELLCEQSKMYYDGNKDKVLTNHANYRKHNKDKISLKNT